MADPESKAGDQPATLECTATKQPLYMRLYFQDHMTEIVRMIGYESLPVPEARQKIESLADKYSEAVLRAATDEILEVDSSSDPPVARLAEHARSLSVGILGRPPAPEKGEIVASQETEENATETARSTPEIPHQQSETPQVRLSRKEILRRFRDWLKETKTPHITLDKSRHVVFAQVERTTLDFIVYTETGNQLVFVRSALNEQQREDMVLWEKSFGTGFEAVRVWPVEADDGSTWNWQPIDAESSAEAAELKVSE